MKPDQIDGTGRPGKPGRRGYRTILGRRILFDEEGFLWQPSDWDEDIARVLAQESGLESLDEKHWRVIRFMRDFYCYHVRAPLNKQLAKGTGMSMLDIESLFPGGIKNGARRIAGLPNPKACL